MEKTVVTIGMVGAGRATELHMDAYKRVKDIEPRLKSIVSKNIEKATAAKEHYGFESVADSFNAMLEDDEIAVIDICTPPYLHEEM
ncbi:MAG: Gfo/Idh/MocA family oxidoreductase, partial [Oscillospiraceae bacterium]|nr:Gfo/Idh/MocA family oxidoreductase [Oscillospiraceae bacterium]